MTSAEVKAAIGKPAIARLKDLGKGLKVGRVLGPRVLVKTVIPMTDLDRIEKEALLVLPEHLKKSYTPAPSTGIVVATGPDCNFTEGGADVAVGEMVMFSRFAGSDFNIGEEEGFRILDIKEILCVLEEIEPGGITPVKAEE